ncbi:MAG: chemotaxis protein CheW [Thermoanaerobaculia bacterium]|jgi:chemotaxis signal transduction protein
MRELEANEGGIALDDAARSRILHERARKLAAVPSGEAEAGAERIDAVVFSRNGVRYGAELAMLREIHVCREIAWVPSTPASCLGVINLRGEILPIFDVPLLLAGGGESVVTPQRILVIESEGRRIGLAADEIEDSISMTKDELQPPLATFANSRAELVRGIARGEVEILDSRKLLLSESLGVDRHHA